jgi:hypothetical protein
MRLGDGRVVAGHRHESVDGAFSTEECVLADGAVGERRPESLVHHLDKSRPGWWPDVELQPLVPQLRIIRDEE